MSFSQWVSHCACLLFHRACPQSYTLERSSFTLTVSHRLSDFPPSPQDSTTSSWNVTFSYVSFLILFSLLLLITIQPMLVSVLPTHTRGKKGIEWVSSIDDSYNSSMIWKKKTRYNVATKVLIDDIFDVNQKLILYSITNCYGRLVTSCSSNEYFRGSERSKVADLLIRRVGVIWCDDFHRKVS